MNFQTIKDKINKLSLEELTAFDEKDKLTLLNTSFAQIEEYIELRIKTLKEKQKVYDSKKYKDFIKEIETLYEELPKLLEPIELKINLPLTIKVEFVKPEAIEYLLQAITDNVTSKKALEDFSAEIITIKASKTEGLENEQLKVINEILEEVAFDLIDSDVERFFKKNRQNLLIKLNKLIKTWEKLYDQDINDSDLIGSINDKKE